MALLGCPTPRGFLIARAEASQCRSAACQKAWGASRPAWKTRRTSPKGASCGSVFEKSLALVHRYNPRGEARHQHPSFESAGNRHSECAVNRPTSRCGRSDALCIATKAASTVIVPNKQLEVFAGLGLLART